MTGKPLMQIGDKFSKLYHQQMEFQERIEGVQPYDDPKKYQYHMNAMTEELGEVLKADKRWKTHRNTTFIPEEKLDELADCYITLMNITMWSGFTADEMLHHIESKIVENNKRLDGRE